jgi:hypothetical protein
MISRSHPRSPSPGYSQKADIENGKGDMILREIKIGNDHIQDPTEQEIRNLTLPEFQKLLNCAGKR